MITAHSFIKYVLLILTILGIHSTAAHLDSESIRSTAGVIVALPNAFFDSFTV